MIDSRTPDSKLAIIIGSSVEEAAGVQLDEEEDFEGTEPALMLRLLEAFRARLFHIASTGEGAFDEVLERQDIGDEILFAFLTLLHLELNHSIASLACNCPHRHGDN